MDYLAVVELQKKKRGPFYGQKKEERGPFPFLRISRPGGGANGTKIPSKYAANFNALEKFYWPMNDLDAHKQKCPLIFAKMRKFRLSENEGKGWERGPFSLGKGFF